MLGRVRLTPAGLILAVLGWAAMHQFGYSPSAMLESWEFVVGLLLGAALYAVGLGYHINKLGRMNRSREEGKFESVMKNSDKITFSRRVGDMAFLGYIEYTIVLNLKSGSIYIFHNDQCLATSNNMGDSDAVRRLREYILRTFAEQINDFVTVNGVPYSRQMVEFYTNYLNSSTSGLREHLERIRSAVETAARAEPEQDLSVDHILDKINRQGISSLSREEMDFLRSQR